MNKLPPADKAQLADYLETMARDLRFQLNEDSLRQAANERVADHRASRASARDVLRGIMWQGIDTARAVQMAELQTGVQSDLLMKWAMADTQKIARSKRNRAIMQKVSKGWTNAAIAEHHGLAEKYVARLISQNRL